MERHITAYDLFALLVPGGLALVLVWALLYAVGMEPQVPGSMAPWLEWGCLALSIYVLGHVLEGLGKSRILTCRGFFAAFRVPSARRRAASHELLARTSELGGPFVETLFSDLNRRFGTTLSLERPRDRAPAFMLCSAFLQQNGSDQRASAMQTLYRLSASLRSLFRAAALGFMLEGVVHLTGTALHWAAPGPAAWRFDMGVVLVVGGALSALVAARFSEKEARYDEYFVSSTLRSYAAITFASGARGARERVPEQ